MRMIITFHIKNNFWHDYDIPIDGYESKEKLIEDFKKVWTNSPEGRGFTFKGKGIAKFSDFQKYEFRTLDEWLYDD